MRKSIVVVMLAAALLTIALSAARPAAASDESNLDMLAKGTIYSPSGEVVQSEVWFTAYPAFGQSYSIGTNDVTSPGSIMVWGNAGEPSDISGPTEYIPMAIGQTLEIDRIYSHGSAVTSYTYQDTSLDTSTPDGSSPITPPPSQDTTQTGSDNDKGLGDLSALNIALLAAGCALVAGVIIVSSRRAGAHKR